MVDREDDLKIGIKSSAITFGKFDVMAVMICYTVTLILLAYAGKIRELSAVYYVGLMAAAAIAMYHYSWIKNRDKTNCFKAFLHNNWFGFSVFAGLAAHYLMQYQQ
jgi:4-hydroxybenzoate polyprenyltransferase